MNGTIDNIINGTQALPRRTPKPEESFAFQYPEKAKEWDIEANGGFLPSQFFAKSGVKVHWKCSAGHSWEATIANRANGNNCPICQKATRAYDDKSRPTIEDYISGRRRFVNKATAEWNFLTERPEQAIMWDYEKNAPFLPEQFTPSSSVRAWFKCPTCGRSWDIQISKARQCPFCLGRRLSVGKNDLATVNPDLANEVSPNSPLQANEVAIFSTKEILWKCPECATEWTEAVTTRSHRGKGCPNCGHQTTMTLEKSPLNVTRIRHHTTLREAAPDIAEQWDYDANLADGITATPDTVPSGSALRVHWICKQGHTWQTSVGVRVCNNTQCPYCTGIKILTNYNDLATTHPDIASEMVIDKSPCLPTEIGAGSHVIATWHCSIHNLDWKCRVSERFHNPPARCPECAKEHRLAMSLRPRNGKTMAEDTAEILADWADERDPNKVAFQSNLSVHWKCHRCGHEWDAPPVRIHAGIGCPHCSGVLRYHTSFAEQAIFFFLQNILQMQSKNQTQIILSDAHAYEADIFLPELHTVIEHDGCWWHNSIQNRVAYDTQKERQFIKDGYHFIRIRESTINSVCENTITYECDKSMRINCQGIDYAIQKLCQLLKVDYIPFQSFDYRSQIAYQFFTTLEQESLAAQYPEFVPEWSTDNAPMVPTMIRPHSNYEAVWVCKQGHKWIESVGLRVKNNTQCPYCHPERRRSDKWYEH